MDDACAAKTRADLQDIRKSSTAGQAAHNLTLLYAATGSMELVKERSKWLAI
jgi:hypothetical protein